MRRKDAELKRSQKDLNPEDFVSTGSTLLNLALTDRKDSGFRKGRMVNLVGDSSAGKSFLALTVLAEAAQSPEFDEYRLIYDDAENALCFDMVKLFGKKASKRIDTTIKSDTVQKWKKNMIRLVEDGRPFIYVLDSFDSLTSTEALDRAIKAAKSDGDEGGSYKTEKPRIGSETASMIIEPIAETGSILIIVSQTRDNIGVTFGEKKTRSGGKWLQFYSTHVPWMAILERERHEVSVNGKKVKRVTGVHTRIRCKKNKVTGKERECEISISYDYGIDDIYSNIKFLVEAGTWSSKSGFIVPEGIADEKMRSDDLRQYIEDNNLEEELADLVEETWKKIEAAFTAKERKPKYE
jgi:recombination protein RecA